MRSLSRIKEHCGIHGSVTKLEQKLKSHLPQCGHNVAGSSNIQTGGSKLIDSVINLKNSTLGKSNRTHVPRRMEPEDIGHVPNDFRGDEHFHDESDEPQPYHCRGRYRDQHYRHQSPRRDQSNPRNQIDDDPYDVMTKVKVNVNVPDFDGKHDPNTFVD
ncbi:hypothetical protein Cgig2_027376 [Carnegiea gigantea]|uniref:Uncharacterized protein n=1 Tax=Carnegiea gigantea TaxID=171969 RepID=A0A9Q1KDV8_9CARY|nr:hypothetical protein Cgig2_027376 [Carnegiea gigantea]